MSKMPQALVDGQQVSKQRLGVIKRAITVVLSKAKRQSIDWNSHDILIKVVPKNPDESILTEGAQ